jgi:serine protease Do
MARSRLRESRIAGTLAVAVLAIGLGGQATALGPDSVADVAAPLLDAVVNISTAQTVTGRRSGVPTPRLPDGSPFQDFFDDFFSQRGGDDNRPRRVQSLGSGFVIDPDGIIVTNHHVIEGADEITANFNDGRQLVATVIGTDDKTDLALLKVESDAPLAAVKFGDSAKLRIGDWVMAIGNPFGLGGTVTVGIVSARNRDINAGPYDDFIQTDASINRGNSGGPLFNMDGEVVGINTAIISPSGGSIGIGFAVPTEIAAHVIEHLGAFGEVRRGWLGVRIQDVSDDIAKGLGMAKSRGALIARVDDEGPAAAIGIVAGDVIVEFDGIAVDSSRMLQRAVGDAPIGREVKVVVMRDGVEMPFDVTLGSLDDAEEVAALPPANDAVPAEPPEDGDAEAGPFGMRLAGLSPELRRQFGIDSDAEGGVVVTGIDSGSVADEKRMRPGDLILEVAEEPVATPEEVAERIAALRKEGRQNARIFVQTREGNARWVNLPLGE